MNSAIKSSQLWSMVSQTSRAGGTRIALYPNCQKWANPEHSRWHSLGHQLLYPKWEGNSFQINFLPPSTSLPPFIPIFSTYCRTEAPLGAETSVFRTAPCAQSVLKIYWPEIEADAVHQNKRKPHSLQNLVHTIQYSISSCG